MRPRNGGVSSWSRPNGHGSLRGADVLHQSSTSQGRFGRMFRTLPAAQFSDEDLVKLAGASGPAGDRPPGMSAAPEVAKDKNGKERRSPAGHLIPGATPETKFDDEENLEIPAGYTYLGQFIDHDITFDPASSLDRQNDPDALIDFRTPRLDLDSLYGRGPDDQPYLYDPDDMRKFALGDELTGNGDIKSHDLPRFGERALIGDKRNDENVVVSQLHGAFLKFHNKVADDFPEARFDEVQRKVRWHYQWLVLHDFLPTIVGKKNVDDFLARVKASHPKGRNVLRFFSWRNEPFMPIEFAAAAYRFGHAMVRPIYRLNQKLGPELRNEDPADQKDRGVDGRQFIFAAVEKEGLNGFRKFPRDWAIDWRLFFDWGGKLKSPENVGPSRVQPAYKIDTSLVNPLAFLPEFSKRRKDGSLEQDGDGHLVPKDGDVSNLALRNLRRGMAMGLPSGQSVARYLGLDPLPDDKLRVGKANVEGLKGEGKGNLSITDYGKSFRENAPLWFYILAEAQHQWAKDVEDLGPKATDDDKNRVGTRLGPVGGRIVMEVLVGLVLGDHHSYLAQHPRWTPDYGKGGDFTIRDLIEEAGLVGQ